MEATMRRQEAVVVVVGPEVDVTFRADEPQPERRTPARVMLRTGAVSLESVSLLGALCLFHPWEDHIRHSRCLRIPLVCIAFCRPRCTAAHVWRDAHALEHAVWYADARFTIRLAIATPV